MTTTQFQVNSSADRRSSLVRPGLFLGRVYKQTKLLFPRLIWYLKGYGTILGMIILVLVSMTYLAVNHSVRKLEIWIGNLKE